MDAAIVAQDLVKEYRKASRKHKLLTLKSALVRGELFRTLRPDEKVAALKGVSFTVSRGKTFGIVGANGSGKSTLLKILAGILKPTRGTLESRGRVASLIELGAGFHPEISGRENVRINAIMLGLSRKEIDLRFDGIVAFAGLGSFIEDPVKTYSSGMYARLGFAVAVSVDPDILLVDEILAVGDEAFSRKCMDKFGEFKRQGKTIVIVSHDLDTIAHLCDEVMWLKDGTCKGSGFPREMIDAYRNDVESGEEERLSRERLAREEADGLAVESRADEKAGTQEDASSKKETKRRWGSGAVEITKLSLLDGQGSEKSVLRTGEKAVIRIEFDAKQEIQDFVFGIAIFNAEGVCCYGTNTEIEGYRPRRLAGKAAFAFEMETLNLVQGSYYLDVAVHRADGFAYDYRHLWIEFKVRSAVRDIGVFRPDHQWSFTGSVDIDRNDK